jgi:hypothetical protein
MATQGYVSANVANLENGGAGTGQIVVSRFVHQHEASGAIMAVKMSGNGTGGAAINAPCLGISQEFPRGTPGTPWAKTVTDSPNSTTHYLATENAGEPLVVYEEGEECMLEAGAAFFSGQFLTWDIHGRGIAVSEAGGQYAYYGAQAKDAATAAGDLVRVVVKKGLLH